MTWHVSSINTSKISALRPDIMEWGSGGLDRNPNPTLPFSSHVTVSKPLALSRIHCFTNDVGTLDFEEAQSTTNMLVLIHLDRQTDRQTANSHSQTKAEEEANHSGDDRRGGLRIVMTSIFTLQVSFNMGIDLRLHHSPPRQDSPGRQMSAYSGWQNHKRPRSPSWGVWHGLWQESSFKAPGEM